MTTVVRSVGYTGSLQRLIWTGPAASIQAYLWGGGGGGGGDEGTDDPGGKGGGSSFARYNFTVDTGTEIIVAVGQGGGGGTRTPGSIIGPGGRSLTYNVFNSRNQSGVIPVSDRRWSYFMNQYAVWDPGGFGITPWNRSFTVNFPVTGYYVFQYSVDDLMTVSLDGSVIISNGGGFRQDPPPFISRYITAGNHTVSWAASNAGGDVAGVALTIDMSFSGGNSGPGAGGSNGGGSGGGGGGGTVLLINNRVVAVAGGGAGGGAAGGNGNTPGTSGPDAPGPWGYPAISNVTLAQDGQGSSIGGAGGGGGGGQSGGNGGRRGGASPANPAGAADLNATAGSYGQSVGSSIVTPTERIPGGSTNFYYSGGAGIGGYGGTNLPNWNKGNGQSGTNGLAVFVMDVTSSSIRHQDSWQGINNLYIKNNGSWRTVKNLYVKDANTWKSALSTDPPVFRSISGGFGQTSRIRGIS